MKIAVCLLAAVLLFGAACIPRGVPPTATGSIGQPNNGRLVDGVQLQSSADILVLEPAKAWGTKQLVQLIEMAAQETREAYPDTVPLVVGHLSRRKGGSLSPHRSHQSGRDVDVAMYAKNN